MSKLFRLTLIASTCLLAVLAAMKPDTKSNRVAYFKSPDRNRVMVFVAAPDIPEDSARDLLAAQMHTDGQLTFGAIYADRMPDALKGLESAASYSAAVGMIDAGPAPLWQGVIDPTGAFSIIR